MRDKSLRSIVRGVLLEQAGDLKIARVDTQEPMTVDIGQEVTLRGSGFAKGMQVTLTSPKGTKVPAESVTVVNPGTATAYLPGLPDIGSYKVEVSEDGKRSALVAALSVGLGRGGPT
jgi:hypothetical protein